MSENISTDPSLCVPKYVWGVPERPNVPGEYYFRYPHPDGTWEVGRMVVTEAMLLEGIPDDGGEWSGPILFPVDPE